MNYAQNLHKADSTFEQRQHVNVLHYVESIMLAGKIASRERREFSPFVYIFAMLSGLSRIGSLMFRLLTSSFSLLYFQSIFNIHRGRIAAVRFREIFQECSGEKFKEIVRNRKEFRANNPAYDAMNCRK